MTTEGLQPAGPLAQPPRELLDEIREKLWTFSAFLFAVGGRQLTYLGGATCVANRGTSYLLTAAHVWREVQGDSFALALDPDRLLIEVRREFVEPRVLFRGGQAEWGPDLALLRLPDLTAAEIRQVKAFYNLERPRPDPVTPPDWRQVTLWAVVGAPAEHSTIKPDEAVLRHSLFDSWTVQNRESDGFDYHDLAFDDERRPGLPRSYGGVSGGGLWQIPITVSANASEISWNRSVRLAGVAFYQISTSDHESAIRCHGRKSLEQALGGVAEQ